jgi:hypothetical protein
MSQPRPVAVIAHRYTITVAGKVFRENASRDEAARMLSLSRATGTADMVTVKHTATLDTVETALCYGCQARPAEWDMDCDGAYQTSECDSTQCDWWKAVRAREAHRAAGERAPFVVCTAKGHDTTAHRETPGCVHPDRVTNDRQVVTVVDHRDDYGQARDMADDRNRAMGTDAYTIQYLGDGRYAVLLTTPRR